MDRLAVRTKHFDNVSIQDDYFYRSTVVETDSYSPTRPLNEHERRAVQAMEEFLRVVNWLATEAFQNRRLGDFLEAKDSLMKHIPIKFNMDIYREIILRVLAPTNDPQFGASVSDTYLMHSNVIGLAEGILNDRFASAVIQTDNPTFIYSDVSFVIDAVGEEAEQYAITVLAEFLQFVLDEFVEYHRKKEYCVVGNDVYERLVEYVLGIARKYDISLDVPKISREYEVNVSIYLTVRVEGSSIENAEEIAYNEVFDEDFFSWVRRNVNADVVSRDYELEVI